MVIIYQGKKVLCDEVFYPVSHYYLDIPGVQWQIMPDHTSTTHITNFEEYIKIVNEFLSDELYDDHVEVCFDPDKDNK